MLLLNGEKTTAGESMGVIAHISAVMFSLIALKKFLFIQSGPLNERELLRVSTEPYGASAGDGTEKGAHVLGGSLQAANPVSGLLRTTTHPVMALTTGLVLLMSDTKRACLAPPQQPFCNLPQTRAPYGKSERGSSPQRTLINATKLIWAELMMAPPRRFHPALAI